MKSLIAIIILINSINCLAQKQDTIVVINYIYKYLTDRKTILNMELRNNIVYLIKNPNSKLETKAEDVIYKKPFCLIYDSKKHLMEKGIWFGEGFEGEYVSYYKNGQIRSKGVFDYNNKVGMWYYYDKKGKVKEVDYIYNNK